MDDINEDIDNLITDMSISIVDELVTQGLVKDSTDFGFQDAIKDALFRYEANFK